MSPFNEKEGYFNYFGYGSNLSSVRLRLDNPSAVEVGIGRLLGYELSFGTNEESPDSYWAGGTATLRKKEGEVIWGVVYKIDLTQIGNLDRQEANYDSIEVDIHMDGGLTKCCRTYTAHSFVPCKPSPAYKGVCVDGAVEHGLPDAYVKKLMAVEDNGDHSAATEIIQRLEESKKKLNGSNPCRSTLLGVVKSSVNEKEGYFNYFGFGSNLSSVRLRLDNPSAVEVGIGRLMDYEMFFGTISGVDESVWTAGAATMRKKEGGIIWGVVYKIDLAQIGNLDRQEYLYDSMEVDIHMDDGSTICCRTYIAPNFVPMKPSPAYKAVCVDGAIEHGLPDEYVKRLMEVDDNGDYTTITKTMQRLEEAKKKLNGRNPCKSESLGVSKSSVNEKEGYFTYFSFGSNLSSVRIRLDNPSAVDVGIGRLLGYEMFFGMFKDRSSQWTGGVATMRKKEGGVVWGVVYKIDLAQIANLDRQEAKYESMEVDIHMEDGSIKCCRTYIAHNFLPLKPSPAYKNVCVDGAIEHGLPDEYVKKLMAAEDNGDHTAITTTIQRLEEAKKKLNKPQGSSL